MIGVGRDDCAPAGDFGADEFGRQPLSKRDEFHLLRDLAVAGVMQLGG
jgi:hypothetical protein